MVLYIPRSSDLDDSLGENSRPDLVWSGTNNNQRLSVRINRDAIIYKYLSPGAEPKELYGVFPRRVERGQRIFSFRVDAIPGIKPGSKVRLSVQFENPMIIEQELGHEGRPEEILVGLVQARIGPDGFLA
jgi:hypothetical protein